MTQLFLLIIVQLFIAVIVVFVLKHLLDRELQKAAVEQFFSLKSSNQIEVIIIYYAGQIPIKIKEELQQLAESKFTGAKIMFEHNQIIKGGLLITLGDQVLDYSVANRLENFWS